MTDDKKKYRFHATNGLEYEDNISFQFDVLADKATAVGNVLVADGIVVVFNTNIMIAEQKP